MSVTHRRAGSNVAPTPLCADSTLIEQPARIVGLSGGTPLATSTIGIEAVATNDSPRRNRPLFHRAALSADRFADRVRESVRGPIERIAVEPYLAHGSPHRVLARGRVFSGELVLPATEIEATSTRVRRTIKRFATSELGGIEVEARLGSATGRAVTDDEGYYLIELLEPRLPDDGELQDMTIEVVGSPAPEVTIGPARAHVPTGRSRRLIVSDIDDTVLETGATRKIDMVMTTLTGSAWTRRSFPGAAELYAGLARPREDEENGFAYVSSSPWNLYGFLQTFLGRVGLPLGPLFLRDLGVDEDKFILGSHDEHKRSAIEELLDLHDLPMVLIGDTGERDPEIYRSVIDAHPGRIEAVLLRRVHDDARGSEVDALFADTHVPMTHSTGSAGIARVAEDVGLIPPGWSDRVAAAEQADG